MARQNRLNRNTQRAIQDLRQQVLDQAFNPFAVAATQQLTVQQMSGPIPDPQSLREYNAIHAGLADRIVKMAEDESVHRRGLETTIVGAQAHDVKSQRYETRIGQLCAVLVSIVGFGCGTYAMTHGAPVGGSVLSGGTLVSIVGAFLYRQHAAKTSPSHPKPVQEQNKSPATAEMNKTS